MCHYSLSHCQQSSIFEQEHVCAPGKHCCIFSAATKARRYVVPRCSRADTIADCLSCIQICENLLSHFHGCGVCVPALSSQTLQRLLRCAQIYVARRCLGGAALTDAPLVRQTIQGVPGGMCQTSGGRSLC